MKQNFSALDRIHELLLQGGEFGEYTEPGWQNPVRAPIWHPMLWRSPPEYNKVNYDLLYASHYGSSAWRFNKKNLRWVIRNWFHCTPSVFLFAYQCRFG